MTAANQNPPTAKAYKVTPEQQIGCALMDNMAALAQFSANQMGGYFKQTDLGDFFAGLAVHISEQKIKFLEGWQSRVQLVGADAMPPAPKVH